MTNESTPETAPRDLFFDLDGTLTDPKPGITGCMQYALERLGRPVPSPDELEWCIGPPLRENFCRLVGDAHADAGVVLYRERFADVGLFENQVYPGIARVLGQLTSEGARLYVASSKAHVFVKRILDHFDLSKHFLAVFGSELDGTRVDKGELLAFALDQTGAQGRQSTMVGDRSHDAIGAAKNDMPFLGVLYGYGSVEEFQEVGVSRWVERPEDLAAGLA